MVESQYGAKEGNTLWNDSLRFFGVLEKGRNCQEAGHEVTIASPAGGAIPIDAGSMGGDFFTRYDSTVSCTTAWSRAPIDRLTSPVCCLCD